jgi:hypothetical protein
MAAYNLSHRNRKLRNRQRQVNQMLIAGTTQKETALYVENPFAQRQEIEGKTPKPLTIIPFTSIPLVPQPENA